MKKKLAFVKTWLKKAHGKEVYISFFKGRNEQVRPHEAYDEEDIYDLVQALRDKAEEYQQ